MGQQADLRRQSTVDLNFSHKEDFWQVHRAWTGRVSWNLWHKNVYSEGRDKVHTVGGKNDIFAADMQVFQPTVSLQ